MRRTRRVCGPFARDARRWRVTCKVVKGRRPADGVGGPRTQQCGDAKHSVKAPSAWRRWELQADKTAVCGTQAKTCFRGPGSSSSFFDDGSNHRPQAERQAGCSHANNMRAPRARLSAQSFRTPLEGQTEKKTGVPFSRTKNRGDDARLLLRHSGAREARARNPYAAVPVRRRAYVAFTAAEPPSEHRGYGFRAHALRACPGMTKWLFDN